MARRTSFLGRISKVAKTTSQRISKSIKRTDAFKSARKRYRKYQRDKNQKYEYRKVIRRGAVIFEKIYSPEAYAITTAKLKVLGKEIPKGPALNEAVKKESEHRINAVGFLKAGWLAAIYVFGTKIGKPVKKSTLKFYKRFGYGGARAATAAISPKAEFWNMAASRHTSTEEGVKIASDGLQLAIDQQIGRMQQYIARQEQKRIDRMASRFLR